ncbi:hypothetical protein EUTSA_v10015821mg, partial [Eutrema salsugineum]
FTIIMIKTSDMPKAVWEADYHRVFLDLCVEQTLVGNKPGTHFSKEGWRNILKSFQEQTGAMYDRMQLKNHWDTMSRQWKIWSRLVQCSLMNWDPETNTFGASDEEWANYLQENPRAGQFRHKEVPHADKLSIIFSGVIEPGETYTPPSRKKLLRHRSESPQLQEYEVNWIDNKTAQTLDVAKLMSDGMLQESPVCVEIESAKRKYCIGECIESLDAMKEVEEGSDLYLFALDQFLKREYREIFLELKKPSLKIAWLQRLRSASLSVGVEPTTFCLGNRRSIH